MALMVTDTHQPHHHNQEQQNTRQTVIIVIKFISVVTIVDKSIVVTRTVTAKHDLGQDIHC